MADTLAPLEKLARHLMVPKYITSSVGALAIYDHLLTLDDEVSYVWRREKSWISYLFIVNRYMLLSYAIFNEAANQEYRYAQCTRNVIAASTLGMTMLLFCDVFMTMRVYAVTGRNKLIALYLTSLICVKAVTGYYFISAMHTNFLPLPDIPIAAFKTCTTDGPNHLQISIHAIGATFDVSAFGIIIWFAYSNVATFRFSFLLRNVVTDATVYFIMATCIQTLVLFFLSFADPAMKQFPLILYTVLIPNLINRVVLSLKKTADVNSTVSRAWNTGHFSSMRFEPVPMTVTPETAGQPPANPRETLLDTGGHNYIPLGDLIRHKKSRLPPGLLGGASRSMA